MSDLTVLVSPIPLYPKQNSLGFNFARRSESDLSQPVMVTLESVDSDEDGPRSPVEVSNLNAAFLSPPRRTFKSSRSPPPQRPASAPPLTVLPISSDSLDTLPEAHVSRRVFSLSTPTDRSELSRPPPPLFRPTTFWRKTKRSGVTSASYSPSSHLIRRSTFIAAGLSLDKPEADLSALCVESRFEKHGVYTVAGYKIYYSLSIALPTLFHPDVINRYGINQAIPPAPTTSDYSDYAAEDTPTLTALLTATSDADPDVTASPQDVVFSSDIPTASLVQITALPPATTSSQAVLPKLPYRRQLNILYLIPLFVALGVVLGAITVATLLKWREKRHRLRRTSTLLPGPPYAPPDNGVEDRLLTHGYPSMEQVSLFAATPSKFTIHGSRYIPERTLTWQTLDGTQPPYTQPTYSQTIIPSSDGERFTVVTQEDPFLTTFPIAIRQSSETLSVVSLPLPETRNSPSLPSPTSGDKPSHHAEEATNLAKPFRRSMFDILKLKSPRCTVPNTRKEYTALPPDDGSADKSPTSRVRRVSSLKTTKMTAPVSKSHSRSARRSLDGGRHVVDMEDPLELLSSQDDKQDLVGAPIILPEHRLKGGMLSSPARGGKMQRPRKVTPFSSGFEESPEEAKYDDEQSISARGGDLIEKHLDIHTTAPERFSQTPHKRLPVPSRRSSAPDTHASVLPLSPPSLMSPPLEKSLFFTSSLSSNVSLVSRMNATATISSPPLRHVDRSFELFPLPSKKRKATKKPRASWPEPPLPYPSYPDHLYAQPTRGKRSSSSSTRRRSVSPGSPKSKGRFTSATHRESTAGICSLGSLSPTSLAIALASSSSSDMLNKVNDIVAQGYTKKMGGEEVLSESI